jgi:hypothetical protein
MNLILGSRSYAPLSDVDAESGPDHFTFGTSDVAVRAEMAGCRRKPLETTRKTLLEMARDGGDVVLFVARDPKTKQPTAGMSQIQTLLDAEGVPFRVVSSPFPGSICEMITELRHAVDKTCKALPGARKDMQMGKALEWSAIVNEERSKYIDRLEESKNYEVGNEELDQKYIRWLRVYEALEDALKDATRMLK